MKQCPQCGRAANDNERFCSVCGAALSQTNNETLNNTGSDNSTSNENITNEAQTFSQLVQNTQPAQPPQAAYTTSAKTVSTRKDFLKLEENRKLYKSCRAAAVFCYCCAAITLLTMCLVQKNWFSLIDVAITIILGLGIHLKQSRVCAIILLVYASINTTFMLIAYKMPGGLLLLAAGIFGVITTFTIHNRWNEYQQQQAYQQQSVQQPPHQQ